MTFLQKIKYFLIKKTARLIIHFFIKTSSIRIQGEENIRELRQNKIPIIFIFWHRHIFFTIFRFKNTGACPLISRSRDGEIVSRIAEEFGMKPVRGSSSSGGARAFLQLLDSLKNRMSDILITADGPRGPLREIKDGTILLAQKTNSVIVPISWFSSRVKILKKTWDQFIVPLPFGRITFAYGEPFYVNRPGEGKKTRKESESLRNALQEKLNQLETQMENICKLDIS